MVWYIGTGVLEKSATSIFRESTRLLQNVSMYLTNYSDIFQRWEYSVSVNEVVFLGFSNITRNPKYFTH